VGFGGGRGVGGIHNELASDRRRIKGAPREATPDSKNHNPKINNHLHLLLRAPLRVMGSRGCSTGRPQADGPTAVGAAAGAGCLGCWVAAEAAEAAGDDDGAATAGLGAEGAAASAAAC